MSRYPMNRLSRILAVLLVALGLLSMTGAGSRQVYADGQYISQGDANSIFHAVFSAGTTIRGHGNGLIVGGGPGSTPLVERARILPFGPSDGQHFCQGDWHVLGLAWLIGGDNSFTYQDAEAELSGVSSQFVVDGIELASDRTSIRHADLSSLGFER